VDPVIVKNLHPEPKALRQAVDAWCRCKEARLPRLGDVRRSRQGVFDKNVKAQVRRRGM